MLRNDSSFPTQSNTPNINLREDEKLLWSGRPKRGLVVQMYSVKGIVRGLLLTGFATYLITKNVMAAQATSSRGCKIASGSGSGYTDILSPGQTPFLIISVILMAIGLYWLIKYSFVDAYIRRRTDYALTNKRAIIMKGLFARREQSINLRLGQEIFVGQKKNDVGTISFGRTPTSPIMDLLVRRRYTPLSRPPQFVMIPDAGYVYDLILHAQKCG